MRFVRLHALPFLSAKSVVHTDQLPMPSLALRGCMTRSRGVGLDPGLAGQRQLYVARIHVAIGPRSRGSSSVVFRKYHQKWYPHKCGCLGPKNLRISARIFMKRLPMASLTTRQRLDPFLLIRNCQFVIIAKKTR